LGIRNALGHVFLSGILSRLLHRGRSSQPCARPSACGSALGTRGFSVICRPSSSHARYGFLAGSGPLHGKLAGRIHETHSLRLGSTMHYPLPNLEFLRFLFCRLVGVLAYPIRGSPVRSFFCPSWENSSGKTHSASFPVLGGRADLFLEFF